MVRERCLQSGRPPLDFNERESWVSIAPLHVVSVVSNHFPIDNAKAMALDETRRGP